MRKKIFFAYESGHPENSDAIKKGAAEYNSHQKSFHVQTWEDLKINGSIINATIFKAIDECEIFACDMTFQNHNVLFELGYAIAKKKKLLIFLNDLVYGAKEQYLDFKVLKAIGYDTFTTAKQISSSLQKKINIDTILIDQLVNVQTLDINTSDIFFINSRIENQASLDLNDFLKSDDLSVVTNYTSEVEYQTLIWYVTNLYKAKIILLHMIGRDKINSNKFNAESSLFAGIGLGLGKMVLLIAPEPFTAPIDYSDILIEYQDSDDCVSKVKIWLSRVEKSQEKASITRHISKNDDQGKKLNLLKLGIGYEIAEEEEGRLLNYFIENESYNKAFSRTSSIILGRKGSGKSALFIKLISDYSNIKNVFNVIIKPDSDELLDNIEFTKLYDNERSRKSFLISVWRFVFLSKLLKSCTLVIDASKKSELSASEQKLLQFQVKNDTLLSLNFYGVVQYINASINSADKFPQADILAPINSSFIRPLSTILQEYFANEKYKKIHILADNLDKSWDSKNDLTLQSEMILALLEFEGKIKNELNNQDIEVNTIIFLRKDIFDFILRSSREPDKLTVKTIIIDWSNYPNKLKDLVEERFRYALELPEDYDIDSVWRDYFYFGPKTSAFEEILKVVVPRPRDFIYFVSRLFECAVNKDLTRVDENCYQYAVEEYSNFLHNNLIAEMKAEFPEIEKIMSCIQTDLFGQRVEFNKFHSILTNITNNENRNIQILESLFDKQYMIGINEKDNAIYSKYDEMATKVNEKLFFFFKKNRIYILLHPRKYMMKTMYY